MRTGVIDSRLLTDGQKISIAAAILSDPAAGNFTVSEMYRNDSGQIVIVFDDAAAT